MTTHSVQTIPLLNLFFAFVPAVAIVGILFKWSMDARKALYAIGRMLVQLLLIGYFLAYIFDSDSAGIVLLILLIMVFSSSWIALGNIKIHRRALYKNVFFSIALGGGSTLLFISQGVLNLKPWYFPQYMIPIAGMIFANSMNSVSLAAERFHAELDRGVEYSKARNIAFHASLIPIMNSLFAVGLVSIPGMMTGQILSGISPSVAARYQIMVMCMVFGSAGISSASFLSMAKGSVRNNLDF